MKIHTSLMRFAATFFVLLLVNDVRSEECTRTCIAQNCDTLSIRYGKYCGIGHFGCPGEEPCDELDACCMVHDNCVESKGMTNISCHKKFQRCVNRLSKAIKQSKNKKCTVTHRNKKTVPPSIVSPVKTEASSKSEKEYNVTDDDAHSMSTSSLSTKIASNSETRLNTTPPHPSSSDDDDDSEIPLRGRRETKPQSSYRHSHVNHEDSEDEEIPTQSYDRSQKRTHQPTTGMRYHDRPNFKTPSSTSYEDEEEVERDVQVNSKPAKPTGLSRRTNGQVNTHEKYRSLWQVSKALTSS